MTNEQLMEVNKSIEEWGLENVENVILIKNGATNGDVVKAMFPNGTTAKFATFMRFIDGEHYFNCSEDWWNALYKRSWE